MAEKIKSILTLSRSFTMETSIATAEDILEFWFSAETSQNWFKASDTLDNTIKARFSNIYQKARKDMLDEWLTEPFSTLALVIILDQFSRNMFRQSKQAYQCDQQACTIVKAAISKHFDNALTGWNRSFLYMPLMHSENIEDQELSVTLHMNAGLDNARYAIHHRDIVKRFGRFPHRNRLLGRDSTQEELAYLASEEAFTG